MKACSVNTRISDPYRAGIALGNKLSAISPEVVFLFASVHFSDPRLLLDGIYDSIGNNDLTLIGCSGDGFLEAELTADHGAAALGLNSEGKVKWKVVVEEGLKADPAGSTRSATAKLEAALGEMPQLIFLNCDFDADASLIEAVLHEEVNIPVVGGYAADDNRMQECFVFANHEVRRDAIAMLGMSGGLRFSIRVGNTLMTVGEPAQVEEAEGTQLKRIGGLSAVDFISSQTGKPVLQTDRGIVSFKVVNPDQTQEYRTRAIVPDFSVSEGTLGLYGGIEKGMQVQVCLADPTQLIADVQAIANETAALDFKPAAALIVSCAGRKWLHGGQIGQEAQILENCFPQGLPLAGFCSFGEIAPLRNESGYTSNLFHNMTYVLLIIE